MMAKHNQDPPEQQSTAPEDRLMHDIEELEKGGGWKSALKWVVILVVSVGAVWAASTFLGKGEKRTPKLTKSGGVLIETYEPARGKLSAAPLKFRWESVQGRQSYVFRVIALGVPRPLVERTVPENQTTLMPDESSQLVPGGRYKWQVEARSKEGTTLGSGESFFDL